MTLDPEWRDAVDALTELDRAATYLDARPGMCGDRDDAREGY
ncbi:Uncharacterised protein [Mycobacteroides abscessus]|nr:Uncharacterised protein [Mycobacteroides abscessus]CPR88577.1 Uncharacterised protein [Mycobacteroides abscessus]CPS43514.1 Uncharacterised protein [Mycobacteroides abscessus]CPV03302.1 Uncharacterised protein [Mycobacteroides abscessus]